MKASRDPSQTRTVGTSTVVERFEYWTATTPESPALILESGETFTYADLHEQVDRVAAFLADSADRTQPVALFMDDPRWAVPAMLGSLKAGRLYVPVDPSDAPRRLRRILSHCTADLILSSDAQAPEARAVAGPGIEVVGLEDIFAAATPGETAPVRRGADEAAFILYTSGSTGLPKGVVHPEATLLRKARLHQQYLSVAPGDRLSLLFSPAVGAATSDIFGSLLNGAAVAAYDLRRLGLSPLADWLGRNEVTVLHTVPTVLRRIAEVLDPDRRFPALRALILAGESLSRRDLESIWPHLGSNPRVWYRLSAAETGMMAATILDGLEDFAGALVPVGHPASDVDIRVLDEHGREVPEGQSGEILVEGDHLALGYWKDEALTATKFTYQHGVRGYRTGDLARRDAQGRLHFLGRTAGRLKLAGHTIEIEEVERALYETGRFTEVAVVGRQGPSGTPELVAFLVPAKGSAAVGSLRSDLAMSLPPYMIPSRFIELGTLPLTSLGKIDRRALPWPSIADGMPQKGYVAPRTEVEAVLCDIWRIVFGLPQIGTDVNFFELGGTSIQAFSVFALLARRLDVDLPPTKLVQAPTIEQLAGLIGPIDPAPDLRAEPAGTLRPEWEHLVALRAEGTGSPLFCLHGGEGYTLSFVKLAERLDPGRPVYGLDAIALDGRRPPLRSVEGIAAHYLAEIRSLQPRGPYFLAGYSFGGTIGFEIAQQLGRIGEEVALLCLLDAVRSDITLGGSRRRQRGRFLRSVGLGLSRVVARTRGKQVDIARRSLRRLVRDVPVRLVVDLVPRGLLRRYCERLLGQGRAVPHSLRQPFYFDLHSEASHRYEPQPYQGRVSIIAADGCSQARRKEWAPFVLGPLDVGEIPCEHMEMFLEPHVERLAEQVQTLLDESSA